MHAVASLIQAAILRPVDAAGQRTRHFNNPFLGDVTPADCATSANNSPVISADAQSSEILPSGQEIDLVICRRSDHHRDPSLTCHRSPMVCSF
jgi:hypothetical protein